MRRAIAPPLLALSLIAIGAALAAFAYPTPAFDDPERVAALSETAASTVRCDDWSELNPAVAAHATARVPLLYAGLGLAVLGATLLAGMAVLRRWDWEALKATRAPKSHTHFRLAAVVQTALLTVGLLLTINGWANFVHPLPPHRICSLAEIEALSFAATLLDYAWLIAIPVWWLRAKLALFPTPLASAAADKDALFRVGTIVLVMTTLASVFLAPFAVPGLVLWLYLRLSLRAGRIAGEQLAAEEEKQATP